MSAKKYGMFAQDLDTHAPAEASERQQACIGFIEAAKITFQE
jgi:hypothetical protein